MNNRFHNATNPNQGDAKKVLCVCSAGLLRSPTAARILCQEPYNFNTRAVGAVADYALLPLDPVLIRWADQIVFMEEEHFDLAIVKFPYIIDDFKDKDGELVVLDVPDNYPYYHPELVEIIKQQYDERRPK